MSTKPCFVVVEYVRVDFMLKGSLMIPHKYNKSMSVIYLWIHSFYSNGIEFVD